MSTAPKEVLELVQKFERNIESYRSLAYNEAQVRREFIDPLFEILDWDISNRQGFAEAYKEVIHEAVVKVGVATKAPDYAFRIGGTKKFFLEAKKPGVDIKNNPEPAYQLRRYAWSAGLPLSILTDFEEFAVYDCRIRPQKSDKASVARIKYLTYQEYESRWGEIAEVFAKQAVLQGSFDRFAASAKGKRGTSPVDDAILAEIEEWRADLARNLARKNRRLKVRDLNFAVQRIIDRIIFLRMCEDRGIESFGQLQALLNGENVYARLKQLFQAADGKYNSGLFYFEKEAGRTESADELTLNLKIDDKVLKHIIGRLYYPESPYEFSVLSGDILGNVYEQFLGKVIHLTKTHQARIEEKPEVKKAGGVYYTPKYIVDYIVRNTVGKLCEGKTPKQIEKLKILDPACGSGSFLIGAYSYLLDYHRDWYVKNSVEGQPNPRPLSLDTLRDKPDAGRGEEQPPATTLKSRGVPLRKGDRNEIFQGSGGQWYLTTQKKKEILLNNIYGVDIDSQAVEVTKLNLLLKVLEGETKDTLESQMRLWHLRALPDLGNNIKCGNSLIGPDYYHGKQQSLFDEELKIKINDFDWNVEFPAILKQGGFDIVIGNPPWISLSGKFGEEVYPNLDIRYLIQKFKGNTYMPNMYEYFVAQGLNLTKNSGLFSFVVPDRLGFNKQFVTLRRKILNETKILSLLYKVPFPGITADTLIFVLEKGGAGNEVGISEYGKPIIRRKQHELAKHPSQSFEYFENIEIMQLVSKIDSHPKIRRIKDIFKSTSGFGGKSDLIIETKTSSRQIPTLKGDSIWRYEIRKSYWFDFNPKNITGRTTDKAKLGASPKILLRKTGDRIIATYDDSGIFPEQSLYFLYGDNSVSNFKFLLGVLNSKLMTAYYRAKSLTNRRSIAQVKKVDLDQLPIPTMNSSVTQEKNQRDKMVGLVEQMLDLHKQRNKAKTPDDKTRLERQIETTDRQIDRLVYELYGLTEEEIAVVEGKAT